MEKLSIRYWGEWSWPSKRMFKQSILQRTSIDSIIER